MKEYPGLSWEAVQRISQLKAIGRWLEGNGDKFKLIPTVLAVINSYESGDLEWNAGLVSYWSHGQKVAEPRPFKAEEFMKLSKEYKGNEGFWVEDVRLR